MTRLICFCLFVFCYLHTYVLSVNTQQKLRTELIAPVRVVKSFWLSSGIDSLQTVIENCPELGFYSFQVYIYQDGQEQKTNFSHWKYLNIRLLIIQNINVFNCYTYNFNHLKYDCFH